PIPHSRVSARCPRTPAVGVPRVVFLGGARTEKGFPLLVEAIRELLDYKIDWSIQCHLDDPSDTISAEARQILDRIVSPPRHRIPEALDSSEYYGLVNSADLIVLPYRERFYRSRTSGIFVEALSAGKPVVTTAGTWMADHIDNGAAGTTFADGNIPELVQ